MVEGSLKYKGIEIRNGFGFDIEVADARPVAINEIGSDEHELAFFQGWVILLPFISIHIGEVF